MVNVSGTYKILKKMVSGCISMKKGEGDERSVCVGGFAECGGV